MTSKFGNNYTHTRNSYITPYYTGENSQQVKERFEALATQWVSEANAEMPAKELHDYLRPNEVVYNTVCPKGGRKETWAATYVRIVDTLVMNDGRSFITAHDFSKAHRKENNLTGDGFYDCHVVRDGKRMMLCDLLPLPIN